MFDHESYEKARMIKFCLEHDIHHREEDKCPVCVAIWERDVALDQVANLEFVVAQLEEKIRLLEQ